MPADDLPSRSPSSLPPRFESLDRRLLNAVLWLVIVVTTVVVLREGKDIFVPMVIAAVAVYLVNVLSRLVRGFSIAGRRLPMPICMIMSFVVIFGLGYLLFKIVAENALLVAEAAPEYQRRLIQLQRDFFTKIGINEPLEFREMIRSIDLQALFGTVASTLAGIFGMVSLVLLYSLFMLIELRFLSNKFEALVPDSKRRATLAMMMSRIDHDIRTYLGVKTVVSLITALISYIIMLMVGLKFAEFWALLVFILNFIPTIGSIVSTLLPTIFAAVHFTTLGPFLVVAIGITAVQQLMGNVLEPNLMGQTLNISPLVVFSSLIIWGSIWGVVGMFLCVPITVIIAMALANFENTRWVSVLLSKTGRVRDG